MERHALAAAPRPAGSATAEPVTRKAGEQREALILGLGNDLISDDGFGPAVVRFLEFECGEGLEADLEAAPVAGFRLLDLLNGYRRALLIDVVQTGEHPPGTLAEWPIEKAAAARTLGGSHQMDLATAIALGRRLGYDLPGSITLLVVEAQDLSTIHEGLTGPVDGSVSKAAAFAREWAGEKGILASGTGGRHVETRYLS